MIREINKLIFGKGNAKLSNDIYTFSLPAGHSCPSAEECLSKADKITGKIKDGPLTQFRCFAASQETFLPNVRDARWHNYNLLRKLNMSRLIQESLPEKAKIMRVHVSGDFFNAAYFRAWMEVAGDNPNILFYSYTKMINYMVKYREIIPGNFILTASYGGKFDNLIKEHNLKSAIVVFSEEEANLLGLEIDHDDTHAYKQNKSFALLIHGLQPAGSKAGEAIKLLNKNGTKYSYIRN